MNRKALNSFIVSPLLWLLFAVCNLFPVLIMAAALAAASGCTSYQIQRGTEACPECTTVKVLSWRNFEQPVLHYERGPDSAAFDFGAESALRSSTPLEAVGAVTLQRVLDSYLPPARPAGAAQPVTVQPPPDGG